jgi:hypothetical protein
VVAPIGVAAPVAVLCTTVQPPLAVAPTVTIASKALLDENGSTVHVLGTG